MMQPFDDIWKPVTAELVKQYGNTVADLWFTGLTLHSITDSEAVIICDMPFKYNIVKSKYKSSIEEALKAVMGFSVNAVIVDKTTDPFEYSTYVKNENGEVPEPVNLADRVKAPSASPSEADEKTGEKTPLKTSGDYNNYTFDNFVVGQSNNLAHAACVAVANDPTCLNPDSYLYNPLFIYGPSGLGKTHLLYAIINEIKKKRPDLKIVYVKGEEFTNELIDSISKKTTEQFRAKYRTTDVLFIDDIQFIAGRDSTQEEFFHTFNALYEDHKQIVLTSDLPPRDIKTLEDRLKTRFEWGITADIQPPDADLRAAIIKNKAASINITLENSVVNFLAENLKSNIRQVEGAIKKLGAISILTGAPITEDLARSSLSDLISSDGSAGVSAERILEKVSKKFGVSMEDLKGTKRTNDITYPRNIAIYLMKKLTELSYPQIGRFMKRDHSTIISSLKSIQKKMGAGTQATNDINELIKEIKD